jgi:hypothetical protein
MDGSGDDAEIAARLAELTVLSEGLCPSDSPTGFRLCAKRFGETSP